MNGSFETEDQSFGRWRNMTEWFEEATAITERPLEPGVTETIPVPSKWKLNIHIPGRGSNYYHFYAYAMEAAMSLLTGIGARPEDAYLERGYCIVHIKPADFYAVRHLAEQIRCWLVNKGIVTIVGDSFYGEHRECVSAYLEFSQSLSVAPSPGKWSLSVMIPNDEGTQLASELGLTVEEGGLRVGGYLFDFNLNDFTIAKAKTMQAIAWLSGTGYNVRTSWGEIDLPFDALDEESLRALNETGDSFHKYDSRSDNGRDIRHASVSLMGGGCTERVEWASRLKRLMSRLEGSAAEVSLKLTRAQVRTLIDLTGEFVTQYSMFVQSIEAAVQSDFHVSNKEWELYTDANKALGPLEKTLDELGNGLSTSSGSPADRQRSRQ
jgi:hypothetical protein